MSDEQEVERDAVIQKAKRMIEQLHALEPKLTQEELDELLRVEPLTGAEIVARGLLGGWEDMGIIDSAEWVNEQKRNHRKKFDW